MSYVIDVFYFESTKKKYSIILRDLYEQTTK